MVSSIIYLLSVLGNKRDETCAVHLTNTYCLPTLLYASESWSVRPTVIRNLNVVWNHKNIQLLLAWECLAVFVF